MSVSGRISHNAWVAGGLATALLMLWFVTTGDTAAGARLRSDPSALKLLRDAAGAARATPYEGMQFITSWSRDGTATTSLLNVSHVPGQGTRMRVQKTTAHQGGYMFESDDSERTYGGFTGYTPKMLDLLVRNYSVVHAGRGQVCGRPTSVVEARRADGSPAGRFHIDRRTGLMLRRELLDEQGREVNFTMFTELRLTMPRQQRMTAESAQSIKAPWTHELAAPALGNLRREGWPVRPGLPGNLNLYDARQLDGTAPVVHLGYSDGLSVVSVFVQRGTLDPRSVSSWRRIKRGDRTVYLHDTVQQRAVWASRGYVYTVVADAPPPTVDRAMAALPHGGPGFWGRLRRGLGRLGSWANPFG